MLPRHLDLPGLSPRPLGPVPALGRAISMGMCAGTHRGMDMHLDACVPTSGKLPEESGSAKSNTPLAKGYNLFLAENNNNQNPYILLLFGFLQLSDLRNCSPVVFLRDTQVFSNTCFYVRKLQEIKIVGKFYPSWPLAVWFSDNTPALSRSGDFFPQQWAVGA